jgi:hypothetical protein
MTDGDSVFPALSQHFAGHQSVNHNIKEFVRDGVIHTNTIEGAFGLFRRSIIVIYHKLSPKHLSRYCSEMEYRYNTRELKDGDRFEATLGRIETRLSWKELTKDNGLIAEAIIEPEIPEMIIKNKQGNKKQVCQMLRNKVVAIYPSLIAASKATNIEVTTISKVVRGLRNLAGGYQWKYI